MAKIIKLTESDLARIVRRIIMEDIEQVSSMGGKNYYITPKKFALGKVGGDITLQAENKFVKSNGKNYRAVCESPMVAWFGESSGIESEDGYTFKPKNSTVIRLEYYCKQVTHPKSEKGDKSKLHLIVKMGREHSSGFVERAFPVYNNELESTLFRTFCK